jgi:hypothetical protein
MLDFVGIVHKRAIVLVTKRRCKICRLYLAILTQSESVDLPVEHIQRSGSQFSFTHSEALTGIMHYELFPESVFLRCPVVYALNKEVRRVMHLSVA